MTDDAPAQRPRFSLTAIAALLALATGGTGLLFTLRPELVPDPRTQIGATIKSVAIDTNVSRQQYFEAYEPDEAERRKLADEHLRDSLEEGAPPQAIAEARKGLATKSGSIVYLDAQGQGLKSRKVTASWFMYGVASGQREGGGVFAATELKAPDDHFVLPTFIDFPANGRCHRLIFVRLELRDDSRKLLAIADTKPFRSCPAPKRATGRT